MIEQLFKNNELFIRRWRRFKRNKIAVTSTWILMVITFFSFTAEFWSNSKPLILSYNNKMMIPFLRNYHPTEFKREDIQVMDYRSLKVEGTNWIVWPINKWDPYESNKEVANYPSGPTKLNWFGTDDRGRDVFARLLYGFRYSIAYAFGVWGLSYLLGTFIGGLMGYLGGKIDLVGSRVVELIEMMPQLLLLITIISIFEPSMLLLVLFSFIFDWTFIYHQVRSQFLQLRKREYVEAAKAIGAGHFRIAIKHILPNALTPLITFSPFAIAANISGLAILDYLGLGLRSPTPSWGELMSQAQKHFTTSEWLVWFPSGALLMTMIALINIGLAVRDAFDAKSSVG